MVCNRPLAIASLVVLLTACDEQTMPGNALGTYSVTGKLTTNSCGNGAGAPDPWSFGVKLSQDGSTLYWNQLDGSPFLSGVISSTSSTITTSVTGSPDATDAGAGACEMQREETIVVNLSSTTAPTSFSGTLTHAFTVVASSNCSDQLKVSGGALDALPCTIAYGLSATKN